LGLQDKANLLDLGTQAGALGLGQVSPLVTEEEEEGLLAATSVVEHLPFVVVVEVMGEGIVVTKD
jgi:hypothetical protein